MNNNNKLPLIGILGHQHAGTYNLGYGQNAAYIQYFREFGNVIIIDAQNEETLPIDLLVLPGGRDVNPLLYGKKPNINTQAPDLEYEWFFENTFKKYLQKAQSNETAIYGICAGFQNIVVNFGGTLKQHYAQEQSNDFRGELVDNLEFNNDFFNKNDYYNEYYKSYKTSKDFNKTNSLHHQAVLEKGLSNDFDIIATNRVYDNIEFISHKTLPIGAEQGHPEERLNPLLTNMIINNLLNTIKNEQESVSVREIQ